MTVFARYDLRTKCARTQSLGTISTLSHALPVHSLTLVIAELSSARPRHSPTRLVRDAQSAAVAAAVGTTAGLSTRPTANCRCESAACPSVTFFVPRGDRAERAFGSEETTLALQGRLITWAAPLFKYYGDDRWLG